MPDTLEHWRYWKSDDPLPSFEVRIGDYEACDWEFSIGFYPRWVGEHGRLVREEAAEFLCRALLHYLDHGAWPESAEALDLPSDRALFGPWRCSPPRAVDAWEDEVPGWLFLQDPCGGIAVLTFHAPDPYLDL